jgi:hypothetical protein
MLQNVIITAQKVTRGEYNIPTSCTIRNQRKRRDKKLILRVKSINKMRNKTINDFQFDGYQDVLTQ